MNLLENVRSGLLKVGAEPFQYDNGSFRPAEPRNRRAPARPGVGARAAEGRRARLSGLFSGAARDDDAPQGAMARYAPLAMMCAAPVLLALVNFNFLIGPAQQTLDRRAAAYASVLGESIAVEAPAAPAEPVGGVSWAQNFVSLGGAMLPGMQVASVRLSRDENSESEAPVLEIEGLLPEAAAGDLRLVAGFIDRLGMDAAFARNFPRVEFAGLSAPEDDARTGAAFRVIAAPEDGQ